MKRLIPQIALMCALAFGGAALFAQMPEGGQMGGGQMGHGPRQPMTADQRLQMMTQQLNLSSEQQQQIKPILETEQQQTQTLRQDTSLSQQDKMSKMQSIHETTAGQIKPILNSEQQAKYAQMMSRHGRPGGPGAPGAMGSNPDQAPSGQSAPPQQ